MSYQPESLFRIMDQINRDVFLPHIQRPFVWDEDQMVCLFDSLMRGFPIQTLLFWKTKDPIQVRKFMAVVDWDAELHSLYEDSKSKQGVEKTLVLDGQQRIQSLFAIFRGSVSSRTDPNKKLESYFDVTTGLASADRDLHYVLKFTDSAPSPNFYRVRDLLEKDEAKNSEDIADEFNAKIDSVSGADKEREKRVRRNFAQLNSLIRDQKHFWALTLDGVANPSAYPYRTVLDIFVRVNSGGTKLSPGDLMFAAMKAEFSDVEENIEDSVELLGATGLPLERDFVLKCLLVALGRGAAIDLDKLKSGDFIKVLKSSWPSAQSAFEQLVDFIVQDLRVASAKLVPSLNSFVPLFDFLFHNPKPLPGERTRMKAYFYRAQIFGWYGHGTDSVIDRFHGVLGKGNLPHFPLENITALMTSVGYGGTLSDYHYNSSKLRPLILNLVYVEKFGASPFEVRYKDNEPQVDHIFPQSPLRTRLGLGSADINHIGNLRFVGAHDNNRKRAEAPGSYFARLKSDGVPIEKHLLAAAYGQNPSLLQMNNEDYTKFKEARLKEIQIIAESVVNI
jgi:hypothetical protein